jgi:hypothetical protein
MILVIASASNRTTYALPGGSSKVALVPSQSGLAGNGGFLVTSGFPGGFSPTFTNLNPADISNPSLSDPIAAGGFDTVVLVQMGLTYYPNPSTHRAFHDYYNTTKPTFKDRIDNFVWSGGKLIIWDSECQLNDYSEFIYPFTVSSPGAMGSPNGQIWIVENNTLSTNDTASTSYVNTGAMSGGWDIGDANVMVTFDPNWCSDMVCKNLLATVGPVQTYARYGNGLIIWNGLDMNYMGYDGIVANDNNGGHNFNYIWYLNLKQQWNPDNLPCGIHTAGITVTPQTSSNAVGTTHTVTATITDNLANPIPGVLVNFTIFLGPSAGTKGQDTTDASGQAHFSWSSTVAGTDGINATANCPFKPVVIYDDKATKTWTGPTAPAVGGEWVPIDKLELSAPLIILASLITAMTASFVYVKRKRQQD